MDFIQNFSQLPPNLNDSNNGTSFNFNDTEELLWNLTDTIWDNETINIFNSSLKTVFDNNDDDEEELSGYISDSTLDLIVLVDYVILSGIICFLGIIFNVINAIIFHRLGFEDTVNIMLFSLALTDLGALLPLLWKAVLFNPWFHDWDDIPFDYMTFQYYSGGWPHACFANISCLIIALVSLDRCLCIAMPLKVRSIITPRRTIIIIVGFYVVLVCSLIPLYCTVTFGPTFFQDKNKTLVALIYSDEAGFVEDITFSFYTFNQLFALVAVILFTTILVIQLKKKSAWRMKTSSARNGHSNTVGRDTKIVKMVLFISVIYIICYMPGGTNIVIMIFWSDYSLIGRYKNICTLVWAKLNILEAFNSTINIFIYINMSSKYRKAFYKMIGRGGDDVTRGTSSRGNTNSSVSNVKRDSRVENSTNSVCRSGSNHSMKVEKY